MIVIISKGLLGKYEPAVFSSITYRSIIEKDGDGYHGYVPALAGCHTYGNTIEETKKLLKEAVLAMLEAKQRLGEQVIQKEEYEIIETVTFPGVISYA